MLLPSFRVVLANVLKPVKHAKTRPQHLQFLDSETRGFLLLMIAVYIPPSLRVEVRQPCFAAQKGFDLGSQTVTSSRPAAPWRWPGVVDHLINQP